MFSITRFLVSNADPPRSGLPQCDLLPPRRKNCRSNLKHLSTVNDPSHFSCHMKRFNCVLLFNLKGSPQVPLDRWRVVVKLSHWMSTEQLGALPKKETSEVHSAGFDTNTTSLLFFFLLGKTICQNLSVGREGRMILKGGFAQPVVAGVWMGVGVGVWMGWRAAYHRATPHSHENSDSQVRTTSQLASHDLPAVRVWPQQRNQQRTQLE